MVKLSDFVMQYISDLGVKNVFLLSGGGSMHLVDSLGRNKNLNIVANLHEQAAAMGADAYSQYTGNLGVAMVTTGPGGTNAITGVTASWIDSIPVLVLSGQVKRADLMTGKGIRQMGPQEVDIISMVKSITKYAEIVLDPNKIKYHLDRAIYEAKNGRQGPVWLDIPLDVQGALIDENSLDGFIVPQVEQDISIANKVSEVINLLRYAERPVILAGNGIRAAGAVGDLLNLVEKLNIPLLTTWKAMDFIDGDAKLFFGRPGTIGQRCANFVQQNSDLIITIGARLDLLSVGFNYHDFARAAKKVIVDIDENEIKKIETKKDLTIVSDAGLFIKELYAQSSLVDYSGWVERCTTWKKKYPVIIEENLMNKGGISTYSLVSLFSELLSNDALFIPGSSGGCSEVAQQAFKVKKGQRIFCSPGLGCMGTALPASIGACIASGKKETICLIGDGSLQHNIQELELLKRYNLPIKLFVVNNNAYNSIRMMQNGRFEGNLVACDDQHDVTIPDITAIGKAYGLKTIKLINPETLKEDVKDILGKNEPILIELMGIKNFPTLPKVSSIVKEDGSIVSKSMEDLAPFLNREEFMENMLIDPVEE